MLNTQRATMQRIFRQNRGDVAKSICDYAVMERFGKVERRSNKHNLSPENYAGRLINDGLRKKWLP